MAESVGERLTAAVPIATLGVGLAALFMGFDWFWMVFVLGFAVLTPLVAVLFGGGDEDWEEFAKDAGGVTTDEDDRTDSQQDALETLRDRYARGELTEEQFERKVERLLETETVEDARERVVENGERERELE
jgi:uncharacterized membrane protein